MSAHQEQILAAALAPVASYGTTRIVRLASLRTEVWHDRDEPYDVSRRTRSK